MNVRKFAAGMAAGALVGVTMGATASAHAVEHHGRTVPAWAVRPCATEDSVDCHWDAATMGNGRGHSFIVREVPGSADMVCVFYVNTRYASSHDYCEATR